MKQYILIFALYFFSFWLAGCNNGEQNSEAQTTMVEDTAKPAPELAIAIPDDLHLLYFERQTLLTVTSQPGSNKLQFSPLISTNPLNFSGWLAKSSGPFSNTPDIVCQVGRDTIKLPAPVYLSEFVLSNADIAKIRQQQYDTFPFIVLCPVDTAISGNHFLKWKLGLAKEPPLSTTSLISVKSEINFDIGIEANPFPPGNG